MFSKRSCGAGGNMHTGQKASGCVPVPSDGEPEVSSVGAIVRGNLVNDIKTQHV